MIRVVVFDFDGTLVDSNRIKENCLRKTVAEINGGPSALAKARHLGGDRYALFREISRLLHPRASPDIVAAKSRLLVDIYSQCCFCGIAAAHERRGARRTLSALKARGFRLWVLSATPVAHLRNLLRRRGLSPWLSGALGSPLSKEEGLRLIMQTERSNHREILMVGDGFDDEAAARAMNVSFVGITAERELPLRGRFAMPDLHRLVPLLDQLCPRPRVRS